MPNKDSKISIFRILSVAWGILLIALCIFRYELSREFWFIPDLFLLGLFFTGIILLLVSVIVAIKGKSLHTFYFRILPILVIGILGFFIARYSYDIFLYAHMSTYEEIVQKASNGELSKDGGYKGVGYEIEKSADNKIRVAFPDGTGIIDNWCGLVWDPSGLIGTVTEESKKLFGGDLTGSRHKTGPWYIACFT
jgi:hypothetical protein